MSPGKQHTDGASWSSASLPSGWLLNTGSVLYFWQNFPLLGFVSMSLCLKKYLFISCYFPFVQSQALQNPCCSAQSHGHTHTKLCGLNRITSTEWKMATICLPSPATVQWKAEAFIAPYTTSPYPWHSEQGIIQAHRACSQCPGGMAQS